MTGGNSNKQPSNSNTCPDRPAELRRANSQILKRVYARKQVPRGNTSNLQVHTKQKQQQSSPPADSTERQLLYNSCSNHQFAPCLKQTDFGLWIKLVKLFCRDQQFVGFTLSQVSSEVWDLVTGPLQARLRCFRGTRSRSCEKSNKPFVNRRLTNERVFPAPAALRRISSKTAHMLPLLSRSFRALRIRYGTLHRRATLNWGVSSGVKSISLQRDMKRRSQGIVFFLWRMSLAYVSNFAVFPVRSGVYYSITDFPISLRGRMLLQVSVLRLLMAVFSQRSALLLTET